MQHMKQPPITDDKSSSKIGALADLRHIENINTEFKAMLHWEEKWGFLRDANDDGSAPV